MILESKSIPLELEEIKEVDVKDIPKHVKDILDVELFWILESGNTRNQLTRFLLRKYQRGGYDDFSDIIHKEASTN